MNYRFRSEAQRRLKRQYRQMIYLLSALVLLLVFLLALSSRSLVQAEDEYELTYRSIQICYGDSLWSIAEENKPPHLSISAYMDQIRSVNHLSGASLISGEYLILPIYVDALSSNPQ